MEYKQASRINKQTDNVHRLNEHFNYGIHETQKITDRYFAPSSPSFLPYIPMILSGSDINSIAVCASCIRAGGIFGLPTETVYGLGANADDRGAVARIFAAKGRPADHPLIVHVADASAVAHFASDVPDFAKKLMASFWPGALTLILHRRDGVATAAAGGNNTIGLRCPRHPVAQNLLLSLISSGHPVVWGIAAPSANLFGRVSPTTAQHVQDEFGDELLILDGGPCSVGIESTIMDCTRGQPVLLRPGSITPDQVHAVCGLKVLLNQELPTLTGQAPKASGTLESHYAPRAAVVLLDAVALRQALDDWPPTRPAVAVWSHTQVDVPPTMHHLPMPLDAASAAQQLFAVLRHFDALGVSQILTETVPDTAEWDGVRDRLQRAACKSSVATW